MSADETYQDNLEDVSSIPIASPIGRKRRHHHHDPRHHEIPQMQPMPEPVTEITLEQLNSLITDPDDYYTNPLVSHTVFDSNDIAVDELDRIIAQLTASMMPSPHPQTGQATTTTTAAGSYAATTASATVLPSLLRPDVSNQQTTTFPSDHYNVAGKIVKNARIYIESVDVPMNTNWSGGIDYLEEGRLLAFSITCNDPDMTPTLFIENASGTTDVINDMSFKQAVQHGRGMTLSEAQSTFMQNGVVTSRDVSGTPSSVFPYVKRYKDQMGGDGVYEDVRNTEDDKSYVMNFEPTTSIPYQRLNFQVFNGSSLGTRMINRLEIKRLVYVDPDPVISSSLVPSDVSQLTTALGVLAGSIQKHPPPPPIHPLPVAAQAHFAAAPDNLLDDYIKFAYNRIAARDAATMKFDEDQQPINVSSPSEQKEIADLLRIASGDNPSTPPKRINDDSNLVIKWD